MAKNQQRTATQFCGKRVRMLCYTGARYHVPTYLELFLPAWVYSSFTMSLHRGMTHYKEYHCSPVNCSLVLSFFLGWLDFMLKIDLAKAFDRIEWCFIRRALLRNGLHGHFIDLIMECISFATFTVSINEQPFGSFRWSRGIRQSCPLSSYIFILVVNELLFRMEEALNANHLSSI